MRRLKQHPKKWRWYYRNMLLVASILSTLMKLLDWLKTLDGREDLKRALPEKVRKEPYNEALILWQDREAWAQRFKPLERHP